MKRLCLIFPALCVGLATTLFGCGVMNNVEKHKNVESPKQQTFVYKKENGKSLALDLFLPTASNNPSLLAVWVHGGAWMRGSKDETLTKNGNLVTSLLAEGVAVAAVNYRLSGEAIYPAAPNDINDAVNFLMEKKSDLHLEADRVIMMGRSAGGHLAALLTTSNNDKVSFLSQAPKYSVVGMVDFFGPTDLVALRGNSGKVDHDAPDAAEALFLGESPLENTALAREASPTSYIDSETPPFIIFHGLADGVVPASQSELLSNKLDQFNVPNQLFLVEGKRHGDPVFDTDEYVTKVVDFVKNIKRKSE